MDLSNKKKEKNNEDSKKTDRILRDSEEKRMVLLATVQALLLLIKDFSLDLEEIDAEGFKKRIDKLSEKFESEKKARNQTNTFEKIKKVVLSYLKREKEYLTEREVNYKDIIEILTKAVAAVDAEDNEFNQNISDQIGKIEKISLLDDIKRIKDSLAMEIEQMKETVREKKANDHDRIEILSRKVSSLTSELEKAKTESLKDGLTGVYNRMAFDRYMKDIISRNVIKRVAFSMVILDIDDFKKINDTYGHQIGDRVLIAVARKCGDFVRNEDFFARYGGEEFVVVLPGLSLRNTLKRANEICKAIAAARYSIKDSSKTGLSITVSIGVSTFKKGDTQDTVTERADKALYLAKRTGKNRVISEKELS